MKINFGKIALSAFLFSLPSLGLCTSSSTEEEEIRKVETQQQEAWNKHDAKSYASLFTENGDCVNVVGWWWKGRTEIEKKLTDAYAFVFRESALTIKDVDVRFLGPDLAVAHVRWTMLGARTPRGIPEPQQGIQTQLLQKQAGKWLIAVFQNTNALPERPFPQGPQRPSRADRRLSHALDTGLTNRWSQPRTSVKPRRFLCL